MKKLAIIMLAMGFAISVPIAAMADGTDAALATQNQSITYDQYAGLESIHQYTVTSNFTNVDWGITNSNFGTSPENHHFGNDPGFGFGSNVGFGQFGVQGYFNSSTGTSYTTTDASLSTMGGELSVQNAAQVGADCAASAGNFEFFTQHQGQGYNIYLNGNSAFGGGGQSLMAVGYTHVDVH